MTPAHLLRAARRTAGVSQRGLAARAGVNVKTVSDIESGRTTPGVGTLQRLVAAAGCELVLDRTVPPACPHLQRYLSLSVTTRLFVTLGGRHWSSAPPVWQQLWRLIHLGTVQVVGAAAVGVWTPGVVERPRVRLFAWQSGAAPEPSAADALDVDVVHEPPPAQLVPVRWRIRPVFVQDPYTLSTTGVTPAQRLSLRAAAALLDADGGRDDGHRRSPAHREVRHFTDIRFTTHTKRFGRLPFPPETDARGWRLDGPVSLAQWLRGHGYPT